MNSYAAQKSVGPWKECVYKTKETMRYTTDDLVKALRTYIPVEGPEGIRVRETLMREAANTIEKLRDGPICGQWHLISNPPKESGWYHVWHDGPYSALRRKGTCSAYFCSSGEGWWDWRGEGNLTHWMPMPDKPQIATSRPISQEGT